MFSEALLAGTLKEAVDALAARAIAARREKRADLAEHLKHLTESAQTYGGHAAHWLGEHRPVRDALIGGGLGAAVGLGSAAFRDRDEDEPAGYMHRALYGGLAGAGLGAAYGLSTDHGPEAPAAQPPAAPASGPGPAPNEHAFFHPGTKKWLNWPTDPAAVADMKAHGFDPGQPDATPGNVVSPIPWVTPTAFGAKGLVNMARNNTAPQPGVAPGGWQWSRQVAPEFSNDPRDLRKGIEEALANEKRYAASGNSRVWKAFANDASGATLQEAAKAPKPNWFYDPAGGLTTASSLSPQQIMELRGVGATARAGEAGFARRWAPNFWPGDPVTPPRQFNPNVGKLGRGLRGMALPVALTAAEGWLRDYANRQEANLAGTERIGRYAQPAH